MNYGNGKAQREREAARRSARRSSSSNNNNSERKAQREAEREAQREKVRLCMGPDGDGNCPHQGHRKCRRVLCHGCSKDKASRLDRPCQGWQVGGCPQHKQARLRRAW